MIDLFFDLETHRFGPLNLAPKPVCMTLTNADGTLFVSRADPEWDEAVRTVLSSKVAGTGVHYDFAVLLNEHPQLAEDIFKSYAEERVTCISTREKLLVLSESGNLAYYDGPDGKPVKYSWKQVDLEKNYLGIDRSAEKEGDVDLLRVNYEAFDGMRSHEFPQEARDYPMRDSANGWLIYQAQEKRAGPRMNGLQQPVPHAFTTEHFQAAAMFALYLQSCWGFAINKERAQQIMEEMAGAFAESNFPQMLAAGVLRPARRPAPYKNQLQRALQLTNGDDDWDKHAELLTSNGIKMTKYKESSICEEQLHALVTEVCIANKRKVVLTDAGNVCFDADVQEQLKGLHPVVDEYIARQEVKTLVTTQLPKLINADAIHPKYNVLVETGRTSCSGDKKGEVPAYPSTNIQNVDPRVRPCFVARPGQVLCSVDFDYLELCSTAQTTVQLFGINNSTLAQRINDGYDPHGYLGSKLCTYFDSDFRDSCSELGLRSDDEVYKAFKLLEELDEPRYTHYRTFAKPTGLGYVGGLGPETFIEFARSQYGVDLIKVAGSLDDAIELAAQLRKIWFETYPEMDDYFKWIKTSCRDLDWCGPDGDRFTYVSPFGMIRRNCAFTAAANGVAMQTPSAEGAKLACWDLARVAYDPSMKSCLFGIRPVAFIHDQIIAEMPLDEFTHERAHEMADIMLHSMRQVISDVAIGAKPLLMLEWEKKAKRVLGPDGRLAIWKPKPKNAA